jgi:hypothetical protein
MAKQMNKIVEVINYMIIVAVFILKTMFLYGGSSVLNTAAMILICVFIALQACLLRKTKLILAVFVFSFLAELLNLIYNGKSDITMLFYFGMHACFLVYLLLYQRNKKRTLLFELSICTFILFLVYAWGFWQQGLPQYLAMVFYSGLLCANLALSYGVNRKVFTGTLLVFLVDTIVVWSLVKGGAQLIRGISWLPFLVGEKLIREGILRDEDAQSLSGSK